MVANFQFFTVLVQVAWCNKPDTLRVAVEVIVSPPTLTLHSYTPPSVAATLIRDRVVVVIPARVSPSFLQEGVPRDPSHSSVTSSPVGRYQRLGISNMGQ